MLILLFTLVQVAWASGPASAPVSTGRVSVAMNADKGTPVYAKEIFTSGKNTVKLVDKLNAQIELAPYSVVEFSEDAEMKLLRGSALILSRGERSLRTSTAWVDFNGKVLVSYDHKEKSSSAFVVEGEARMINPAEDGSSLRLERWRGATLEMGGVLPQLIRQLDLSSLQAWMKGYAWPDDRREQILKGLPAVVNVADFTAPTHLEEAKIEDYFSSIDTDSDSQPDYYDRKFSDPDAVVAESKSKKPMASKSMSPEEAALITLPSTKIDLGFEVLGSEQKSDEVSRIGRKVPAPKQRSIASVKPKSVKTAPREDSVSSHGNEVEKVLERLRGLEPKKPVVSEVPKYGSRSPASLSPGLVPDPVYDYSENF